MNVNKLLDEAVRREAGKKSINRAEAADLWFHLRTVLWEATRNSTGAGIDLNQIVRNPQFIGLLHRTRYKPKRRAQA